MTFRTLQAQTEGIATSVLNTRLRELRDAAIVEHDGDGFALTDLGRGLLSAGEPLVAWAQHWADSLDADPGST